MAHSAIDAIAPAFRQMKRQLFAPFRFGQWVRFAGWFANPLDHLVPLVLGGVVLGLLVLALTIAASVIHVMTKDFVVPQMAMDGTTAVEGWRRLAALISADRWSYAGYIGMKIVLSIGAAIVLHCEPLFRLEQTADRVPISPDSS